MNTRRGLATALAALAPLVSQPAGAETGSQPEWSFSGAAYTYFLHDERNYLQPTVTADRDWLHLESRYNYESLHAVSVWMGYNFSGGDELAWEVTPMLGGVYGAATGIAPGYKGSLSWRRLALYSEGEYIIDLDDESDSFFYNWSEATFSAPEWLRYGLVTQRTRAYEADREIQRGLLAGISLDHVDLTAYVFNLDDSKPLVVLAAAVSF